MTTEYARLEERILARDQVGASQALYTLFREKRPVTEIVRETVRIHAPYTHVPYHQRIDNGFVRFGGFKKVNGQTDPSAPFTVDVQDNGQPNQGQDMIVFRQRNSGDDPCDTSDQNTQLRSTTLARGNVKNH